MKRNLFIGLSLLTGVPMAAQQKQQEHPNLIFVITDQLRNDVFGCRGDEIAKTPNIDRFKCDCGHACIGSGKSFSFYRKILYKYGNGHQ